MEIKNILIVKGGTQYGVLNVFADSLAEGFKKLHMGISVFDATLGLEHPNNLSAINSDYDMIFSFNCMALDIADILIKRPNTLVWSFLVDHPYQHHPRLLSKCNNHIISCVDKKHADYANSYYSNIDHTFFIPHGGNPSPISLIPYENRCYEICLIGSYQDIDQLKSQIDSFPEPDKSIIMSIISQLTSGSNATIEELLHYQLLKRNIKLPDYAFANLLFASSIVDIYIRNYNRKLILDKLTSEGITIDVFGNGWESYNCKHPENLRYHGNKPYHDILSVMSNSKIVLNPLPLFRDGSHERVFSSMLCGALCLSEINTYLSEEFSHGKDIVFYDMSDLDTLASNIKALLSDANLSHKISENGKEKVFLKHLWENRAKDIIEYANARLIQQPYKETYISLNNKIDHEFNSIMDYLNSNSTRRLSSKMKSIVNYYDLTNPDYIDLLRDKFSAKGLWPKPDYEGNIFCRNQTKELKEHTQEYVLLYEHLHDISSKKVLVGILNNRLYFSHDALLKISSTEYSLNQADAIVLDDTTNLEKAIEYISSKLREEKPKLIIALNSYNNHLWIIPKLILQENSTYKFKLRYQGDSVTSDGLYLYAE